jgi:hypothetical protein
MTEYFEGTVDDMQAIRFYLEMNGDRLWMSLYPTDLDKPETWSIEDAKLYDLASTMDSMAESIKEGHLNDINMADPFTMMILKDIKDWINKDGNLYEGKSWYGYDDYSEFIVEDKEGIISYKGEKLCHTDIFDECNEDTFDNCEDCKYKRR